MLVYVRCFSYTPDASFSEEFLLHLSGHDKEFFYTPDAISSQEFVYTPQAIFGEQFLLQLWC